MTVPPSNGYFGPMVFFYLFNYKKIKIFLFMI